MSSVQGRWRARERHHSGERAPLARRARPPRGAPVPFSLGSTSAPMSARISAQWRSFNAGLASSCTWVEGAEQGRERTRTVGAGWHSGQRGMSSERMRLTAGQQSARWGLRRRPTACIEPIEYSGQPSGLRGIPPFAPPCPPSPSHPRHDLPKVVHHGLEARGHGVLVGREGAARGPGSVGAARPLGGPQRALRRAIDKVQRSPRGLRPARERKPCASTLQGPKGAAHVWERLGRLVRLGRVLVHLGPDRRASAGGRPPAKSHVAMGSQSRSAPRERALRSPSNPLRLGTGLRCDCPPYGLELQQQLAVVVQHRLLCPRRAGRQKVAQGQPQLGR